MVSALRSFALCLPLSFVLFACSAANEADGTGPVVDDVGSVIKIANERAEELRVVVSFHHPEGEAITQYSFVPRGDTPRWRDFPREVGSEGNQVELTVEAKDVRKGTHAFDLMLRDDRGRAGPHHRVTFTLVE